MWEEIHFQQNAGCLVLHKYLSYSYVIVVCHGMVIRSQVDVQDIDHAEIVEYTL